MNRSKSLEQTVLRDLKEHSIQSANILAAVSGGVDSLAMLNVLNVWRRRLQLEIRVAHVHHGAGNPKQVRYRDRAQFHCQKVAQAYGFEFLTNTPDSSVRLKSEAELRKFRYEFLDKWREEWERSSGQTTYLALAHHRDDVFETRMIRLIRGTGEDGLVGMTFHDGSRIRPLLHVSRHEIEEYARRLPTSPIADPSNKATDAFRNWIRRRWLPALEKRQAGSVAALARSLEQLARPKDYCSSTDVEGVVQTNGIGKPDFNRLSLEGKRKVLIIYMRQLGLRNYTQRHVDEILKRLKTGRKAISFSLLGCDWEADQQRIWARVENRQ